MCIKDNLLDEVHQHRETVKVKGDDIDDIELLTMTEHVDTETSTAPLITGGQEIPRQAVFQSGDYNKILIWFLSASAGISGLLFGYDTGVISSMLVSIGTGLSHRPLSEWDKGLITACTSLFALIASPFAGSIADKFGRKRVILLADLLFILGALWQALTAEVWGMIGGRCVVGVAIGGASMVIPLYISELAPSEVRGRLVTINCLFITGGQVVAYITGWLFSAHPTGWRWTVGLGAVPAALQLLALVFMSESPRWLVKIDRVETARSVLATIYNSNKGVDEVMVARVLKAIEQEHLAETSTSTVSPKGGRSCFGSTDELESLLYVGPHRRALTIACLLQGLQQLSGFNVLMYFSATLFEQIGFSSPTLTALSVALTNFVFTLVAFYLIDRIGRRRILLYSIPFMTLSLLTCAAGFIVLDPAQTGSVRTPTMVILVSLILYVASYASGIGNVPWQQSELFPLSVRSLGSSISTLVNWSSNFVIGLTFLPMMNLITPGWTFVCYAVVCAVGWVCIWHIYPETMGLSLEEVNALLKDGWGVKESDYRRIPDRID